MVVLNRIYTKTGDGGSTALGDGTRRRKHDPRVEAYGTVDEANSAIGLARAVGEHPVLDPMLARIQNDLFDLGADLCRPPLAKGEDAALRIVESQVARLEAEIDALNAKLEPLRSFVLPGGAPLAAALHVARATCRRAERLVVALADMPGETVGAPAIAYVNRLSDFLFVAARIANDEGRADVLWTPGLTR
ncbi:MAG: cob(I)yrinic acid a,c-diamide adenosyltransferase [Hyphomicrobiales bacterium]|nr:cob(I)yrinic acid a,c-diamide adenosyltransferase [Hyphomicrobiales bacterium]